MIPYEAKVELVGVDGKPYMPYADDPIHPVDPGDRDLTPTEESMPLQLHRFFRAAAQGSANLFWLAMVYEAVPVEWRRYADYWYDAIRDNATKHIEAFDPEKVLENQPWLTSAENDHLQRIHDAAHEGLDSPYEWKMYILTPEFKIVEEPNSMRWSVFLRRGMHRVIDNTIVRPKHRRGGFFNYQSGVWISTVFIGTSLDELFETMIFGGPLGDYQLRTQTLKGAKKNHWELVDLSRRCKGYLARHKRGRKAKKAFRQLDRMDRLAKLRGPYWLRNHLGRMLQLWAEVEKIPGSPESNCYNLVSTAEKLSMVNTENSPTA